MKIGKKSIAHCSCRRTGQAADHKQGQQTADRRLQQQETENVTDETGEDEQKASQRQPDALQQFAAGRFSGLHALLQVKERHHTLAAYQLATQHGGEHHQDQGSQRPYAGADLDQNPEFDEEESDQAQ